MVTTSSDFEFQYFVIGSALALSGYVIYRDEMSKDRPNVVTTSMAFALGLFGIVYGFGFGEAMFDSLNRAINK